MTSSTKVIGTQVYGDLTQEALDREYNNRARIPDHEQLLEGYRTAASDRVATTRVERDIAYGPSPEEILDLYLPAAPENAPVIVFLHGGFWMSRHKEEFAYIAPDFTAAGAILAVVEYALMPTVDLAEVVRQCRAATAWAHAHAADYGGDAARLVVTGNSAGGHLTAMMQATDWQDFCGGPAGLVHAGVALSGIYDLEPIRHTYMQPTLNLSETDVAELSPVHLAPVPGSRGLIAVGGDESPEFLRQSQLLVDDWSGKGADVELMTVAGCNHFSIVKEFATAGTALHRRTLALAGLA